MYLEKEYIAWDKYLIFNGLSGDLKEIVRHALKSSDEFLYELSRRVDKILISRNQLNRHYFKPYYDFNYPNFETCKEFIKNGRYAYLEISFVIVLFDWYELYDEEIGLSDTGYELALYLKRHKYIKEKIEILNEDEKLYKIHYPDEAVTEHLNFNSIFDELDIENIDLYDDYNEMEDLLKQNLYHVDHYPYRDIIPI